MPITQSKGHKSVHIIHNDPICLVLWSVFFLSFCNPYVLHLYIHAINGERSKNGGGEAFSQLIGYAENGLELTFLFKGKVFFQGKGLARVFDQELGRGKHWEGSNQS